MKDRLPVLDGLRGAAVLLVLMFHSADALNWPGPHTAQIIEMFANTGVDLFFVLSGFLMFLPYARSIIRGDRWPSWQEFYIRRARRILPAFYVTSTVLFILLTYAAGVSPGVVMNALLYNGPAFITLLYDMWHATYLFAYAVNGVLWTLAIEWQFYLILPWLAMLLRQLARQRPGRLFIGLGGVIVWGVGVRALAELGHFRLGWSDPVPPLIYGQNGKRLELFALGMIVAAFYVSERLLSQRRSWLMSSASYIGLVFCIWWSNGTGAVGWSSNWTWTLVGDVAVTACYAGILWACLSGVTRLFSMGMLRWLGKISFSVYLIHATIIWPAARLGFWAVIFSWGAILLLSTASYRYVESPFLKTRPGHRLPVTQAISQHAP